MLKIILKDFSILEVLATSKVFCLLSGNILKHCSTDNSDNIKAEIIQKHHKSINNGHTNRSNRYCTYQSFFAPVQRRIIKHLIIESD